MSSLLREFCPLDYESGCLLSWTSTIFYINCPQRQVLTLREPSAGASGECRTGTAIGHHVVCPIRPSWQAPHCLRVSRSRAESLALHCRARGCRIRALVPFALCCFVKLWLPFRVNSHRNCYLARGNNRVRASRLLVLMDDVIRFRDSAEGCS
jgi:hypothetical protein